MSTIAIAELAPSTSPNTIKTASSAGISADLAARTGLIINPLTTAAINQLFDELESYETAEQCETLADLKQSLAQTRSLAGAEPLYRHE